METILWTVLIVFIIFVICHCTGRKERTCPVCGKVATSDDSRWFVEDPKNDRHRYYACKTKGCDHCFSQKMHYKSARGLWMNIKTPYGSEYID